MRLSIVDVVGVGSLENPRLKAVLAAVLLSNAVSLSSATMVSAQEETQLKRIVVEGGDASTSADNDTTVPKLNETALKTATPLVETPRSVAVVTRTEIEQRAVNDMIDAVRYSAAVTTGQFGYDPRFDQITIRGFSTVTTSDFRDGLRQPYMNYATFKTETFGLERIEVLKGPASVLYGSSSAAGIVNRVTKIADGDDHRIVETQYGSYDRMQLGLDYGQVSQENDAFSWRVVALGRKADTDYGTADDRFLFQPSFRWAPDGTTSLTVYAIGNKDETDVNVQTFKYDGEILRYSDPAYDYQRQNQFQTGYLFEHQFDNGLTFKQHVRYNYLDLWGRYLEVDSTDAANVMKRYPVALTDQQNSFQADNRVEGEFDTGSLSHRMIGGLDYTWIDSSFGLGFGTVDPRYDFDLNDPDYGVSGPTTKITSVTGFDQVQTGLYVQDQIAYENWRATLGLRHDWVSQTTWDETANTQTGHKNDSAWSYQSGLLYHFDSGWAPYVNYATSFVPQSQLDENGAMVGPMTGRQLEVGVKLQPDDADYSVSAAYYHLVQSNAAKYAGMNDTVGYFYKAIGEVTADGFEIEARKSFVNGFSLIGAYNYNNAEITKSITASEIGNRPSTTPLHTASLWVNYKVGEDKVASGLGAGLGLRYNSASFTSDENVGRNNKSFYLDAAVNYDFSAQHKELSGLEASFSVKNIFNKRQQVCTDGFCYFGQGRTVLGTMRYKW